MCTLLDHAKYRHMASWCENDNDNDNDLYCPVAFCVGSDLLVLYDDDVYAIVVVVLCKILLWIVFPSFFFAVSYVLNASPSPSPSQFNCKISAH